MLLARGPVAPGTGLDSAAPVGVDGGPGLDRPTLPVVTTIPSAWVPPAVPAGAGWHRLPGTPMTPPLTWANTDESTIVRFDGLDVFVGNREEPGIWSSGDGVRWEAAKGIDFREDPAEDQLEMVGLAATGTALVAVAEYWNAATQEAQPALWRSVDGRNWTRVTDPAFHPGVRGLLVGATSRGFVVFGFDNTAPDGQRASRGWTSTDGSTWQPIASETASAVQPGLQLLAGIDGVLTAFRNAGVDGPLEVWQAAPDDLASWQRVGSFEGSEPWGFVSVAKGPGGWLAIGRAIYRSVDGRAWSPVLDTTRPGSPDYPDGRIALVGDGAGFIATTAVPTGEGCVASGSLGVTWVSADGVTWRRLPVDPQFENATIFGLISRAGVVLGLGWSISDDSSASAIWIADRATLTGAADPTPSPSTPSRGGCGEG